MAISTTGMVDYTQGKGKTVIKTIILQGNSMNPAMGLGVEEEVKLTGKVPDITAVDCTLQGGKPSDSVATGDDTFVDLDVTNTYVTLHKEYDTYDFDAKVTKLAKKQGTRSDDDAYLAELVELTAMQLTQENDKMLWLGDTTGAGNLALFDGFVKEIKAGSPIKTGSAAVKLDSSNAVAEVEKVVNKMVDSLPAFLSIKTRLFMSPEGFFNYRRALEKQNVAVDKNTKEQDANIDSIQIPGTNVWATSVAGLAGSNELILTRPENIKPITDLVSEDTKITLEYLVEGRKYRLLAVYKLGAKVARVNECVIAAV